MRQEAQDFEKYENLEHAFQKKTHEIMLLKKHETTYGPLLTRIKKCQPVLSLNTQP